MVLGRLVHLYISPLDGVPTLQHLVLTTTKEVRQHMPPKPHRHICPCEYSAYIHVSHKQTHALDIYRSSICFTHTQPTCIPRYPTFACEDQMSSQHLGIHRVAGSKMASERHSCLILRNCEYVMLHGKEN